MRQICPHCQQSVTVADSEAGKTIPCPACQQPFAVAALFNPQVMEPAPVPPVVAAAAPPVPPPPLPVSESPPPAPTAIQPPPPAPTPTAPDQPPSPPPAAPAGYRHSCFVALNSSVCHWLTPICLTLALVLSFFNWVGSYPAGYAAYTQNGWQALAADLSADPVSEKEMKSEKKLTEALRSSWWLLPYMIFLLIGVLAAWSEPIVKRSALRFSPIVNGMLRRQPALLAACAGVTLIFLIVQYAAGFGVERALDTTVAEQFREATGEAKTPEEHQKVEMQMAGIAGAFNMRTTNWLRLLVVLHFLALAAIIAETLLIHRGNKPPPRIGVMW